MRRELAAAYSIIQPRTTRSAFSPAIILELRRLYGTVVRTSRSVVPRNPMGTVRIIATNARLHGRRVMNWRFSCPEKNGEEDVMKRCSQCGGKFGLVRYTFFRDQFCSKKCLQAYKLDLDMKCYRLRLVRAVQSPTQRQTDASSPRATSMVSRISVRREDSHSTQGTEKPRMRDTETHLRNRPLQ